MKAACQLLGSAIGLGTSAYEARCCRTADDPIADGVEAHEHGTMMTILRSPWFALATVALLTVAGILLPEMRGGLLGLAGFATVCGLIDYATTNSEDRGKR